MKEKSRELRRDSTGSKKEFLFFPLKTEKSKEDATEGADKRDFFGGSEKKKITPSVAALGFFLITVNLRCQ